MASRLEAHCAPAARQSRPARSALAGSDTLFEAFFDLRVWTAAQVLGAPWQRCIVHFLRDLRGHVRRDQHDALGTVIRQIFNATGAEEGRRRLRDAVSQLERRLPKIAALIEQAEPGRPRVLRVSQGALAPAAATNPLERFNREIGRRTDIVGIFPDDQSVIRLVSMLAIDANDERLVGRGYISRQSMAALYEIPTQTPPALERDKEASDLIAA